MAGNEIKRNYIYEGHVIDVLRSFPAGCIKLAWKRIKPVMNRRMEEFA